jgi:DNA-binding NarL/FixJ family response regulator
VIRVLLVDDQPLLRGGLRILVEAQDDMVVAGEAADGLEAVALANELRPDVVLMDVSMPRADGVQATREIVANGNARVLVLTTFDSNDNVLRALRAGASGFLLKDAEPGELLRAIRVIALGEALLSPSATRRLISEFTSRPERRQTTAEEIGWLTEREREVVALVAVGLSNQEIAAELVISRTTAKTHVSRAMRKLRAHDRAQLVVLAYASGLVRPGVTP